MAERRMFSSRVTGAARFLRLPPSAQALYFHLGLYADDEGIAEGFSVVGMVRGRDEDLYLLEEKGFVKILNEDLVTYIVDWNECNQLRADRAKQSIYHDLLEDYLGKHREGEGAAAGRHAVGGGLQEDHHAVDGDAPGDHYAVDGAVPESRHAVGGRVSEDCHAVDSKLSADCQQTAAKCPQVVSEMSATCRQSAADCQQVVSELPTERGKLSADCQQTAAKCPPSIVEDSIGKYRGVYTAATPNCRDSSGVIEPPVDNSVEKLRQQQPDSPVNQKDLKLAEVFTLYQDNIHSIPNQVEADDLSSLYDEFGQEWLIQAIKEAARARARSIKYIISILEAWAKKGVSEPWKHQDKKRPAGGAVLELPKNKQQKSHSEKVADIAQQAIDMLG